MLICNLKINSHKVIKFFILLLIAIILTICVLIAYNLFFYCNTDNCTKSGNICVIDSKNYTNVLNEVHNNVDKYAGKKIRFSGYIYRVYDFNDNQFVLARDMIISSDHQTVVVGFLCGYSNAQKYPDNTWVEIEGTITKGIYHEEIPIIQITDIKEISKPKEEYVYPPDETFIPTSDII